MINPGDYILLYRNGHVYFIGTAGCVRGFDQKSITISYASDWGGIHTIDVDRQTGLGELSNEGYLQAKVVTKEEWDTTIAKKKFQDAERDLKLQAVKLLEQAEEDALIVKAEAWYETLPDDQKKMIDALCWSRRPIAVA
jgi:hypothetical protein